MATKKTEKSLNDMVEECLRRAADPSTKVAVYDVETSGLDWKRDFICGYVWTFGPAPQDTYYLPVRHVGGGNVPGGFVPKDPAEFNARGRPPHPLERRISAIAAERSDLLLVGHAVKFDLNISAAHGIVFAGPVECTRVNGSLLDENQGEYDLDACCAVMGVPPKFEGIYKAISDYMATKGVMVPAVRDKAMAYFYRMPADGPAATYASQDGMSTWDLMERQHARLEAEDQSRVHAVEKMVTKTLHRMELRGVPVDEEKLAKVSIKSRELYQKAIKSIPKDLNVKSNPQMFKYIVETLGRSDYPLTPAGKPSFPEGYLEEFDEGQSIILVRKLQNFESTFLEGSIKSNLFKGRIHCQFNQTKMDDYGTVTGRLSSSLPNMQQIPKRNKILGPLIRQVYVPDRGRVWWSFDLSQQEYRCFADYAQAKLVLKAYREDPRADYHQIVADLLGVERDPTAKRLNLGQIYGMGVDKLARSLGVSRDVAQGYLSKMREMMPEAKEFLRAAEKVARRRGYVFTKLGRRRRFPNSEYAHKAGNSIIQGSCADQVKERMALIDKYLIEERANTQLVLQVHDSLEFLGDPLEERHRIQIKEIMEETQNPDWITFDVPMKADFGSGPSWGHATFGSKYDEWL